MDGWMNGHIKNYNYQLICKYSKVLLLFTTKMTILKSIVAAKVRKQQMLNVERFHLIVIITL